MKISCNGYTVENAGEEVLIGNESGQVLLHLRGEAAKRVHELIRRDGADEIKDLYTCHAAAEFVLYNKNADRIRWTPGEFEPTAAPMDVRRAVEELELPCGFQLHAMDMSCDGDGAIYLAHSGVLLGIPEGGEPLVLEKNGRGSLRICTIDTVRATHKRPNLDTFLYYGTSKTATPSVS